MITFFYSIQIIKAVENDVNSKSLRNYSMYDNTIKVTKNVNTKIALEVRRFDRKAIKISRDKRYYINVISDDGELFLLRKQFQPEDIDKGRFSVLIEATDLDLISPGRYNYSVSFVDETSAEYLLYTNENPDAQDTFIVDEISMPLERPPYVQFMFTKVRTLSGVDFPDWSLIKDTYISSRLPITKSVHTLELDMTDFTGKIKIQTTRVPDPNDQVSWSDWDVIECAGSGNTQVVLNDLKVMYVRVQIEYFKENTGSFTELRFF